MYGGFFPREAVFCDKCGTEDLKSNDYNYDRQTQLMEYRFPGALSSLFKPKPLFFCQNCEYVVFYDMNDETKIEEHVHQKTSPEVPANIFFKEQILKFYSQIDRDSWAKQRIRTLISMIDDIKILAELGITLGNEFRKSLIRQKSQITNS